MSDILLCLRQNLTTNFVFNSMTQKPRYFPINVLRNVAMQFAPTDTVLLSEADFIPQPSLDLVIRKHVSREALALKRVRIQTSNCFANV